MRLTYSHIFVGCCLAAVVGPSWVRSTEPVASVDFRRDVQPILEQACGKCHGAQKQHGGARFDQGAGVFQPADWGSRPIVPGDPAKSELLRRVVATDATERMPPEGERLGAEQIRVLRAWIEQGANWPQASEAA